MSGGYQVNRKERRRLQAEWRHNLRRFYRQSTPVCLDCDHEFTTASGIPGAFSVVASVAAEIGDEGELTIVTGICRACAARSDGDLLAVAYEHLRELWPGMRVLDAAHLHERGRA